MSRSRCIHQTPYERPCQRKSKTSMTIILERAKGLEPSTPTLARLCSTTELHPHPRWCGPPVHPVFQPNRTFQSCQYIRGHDARCQRNRQSDPFNPGRTCTCILSAQGERFWPFIRFASSPLRSETGHRSHTSYGNVGGIGGDRTLDLVIANDALSQLSYNPIP